MCAMYIPYIFVVFLSTPWLKYISEDAICPISQQVMEDPVVCADGHSYERAFIQKWLAPLGTAEAQMKGVAEFFVRITYGVYIAISD